MCRRPEYSAAAYSFFVPFEDSFPYYNTDVRGLSRMRMRKKKNLDVRFAACADVMAFEPKEKRGKWRALFGNDNPIDLAKGAIISFTGTYEKANDDITVVSNTQKSETVASGSTAANAESQGYIAISNDWSDSSKLIRSYQGLSFNGGTAYNIAAGKVVSDSVVINIDEDDYVADDATPSKAEELKADNGYYANAFVIVNKDNEIDLLVYETNNRIKDGNNNEVTLTNHADVAAISAGTGLPTASDNVETVKAGYTVSGLGTGLVGKVATKLTDDKDSNKAISAGDTVTATLTVTADTGYQLSAKAPALALAGWTVDNANSNASQWVYTLTITVA